TDEFLDALPWQRIQAELRVRGLIAPAVLIFRTIADEDEELRRWETHDQSIEERLRLGVDPLKILDDQQDGARVARPEQEAFESVQRSLATLGRIERLPSRIGLGCIEKREQRRNVGGERRVESEKLRGHLLHPDGWLLALIDVEIALEEIDDG